MLRQLIITLACLNLGTLLFVVGVGLMRWGHLSISLRLIWWALLSYLVVFAISLLTSLGIWQIGSNLFLEYLVPAIFGSLFAIGFILEVPPDWRRWAISGLMLICLIALLTESLFQQNFMGFSRWAVPLETILSAFITLIYLQYLLRSTTVSLLVVPLLWISLGRLASGLLSTVYDALHAQLMESSRELLLQFMAFQMAVMIGCNILYGIGYWKVRR